MPIGYCCDNCKNDESITCLKSKAENGEKSKMKTESMAEIKLISTSIEGELLKVIIELKDEKEKTVLIDLKKYLEP
jgi:hypothetical protein